ncbi:MAG: hypothetical protein PWP54_686 [Thermosipho sp. (in: thermotogales)]|nr:hypothetical protein [Thermosipho sp. (in: thermotogales)]
MVLRTYFKNLNSIERYYGNYQVLMITNPDPFSDAQYVVPEGYKLVFFADRNIFITSNNQTFTIKPRQVYFFYKE